MNERVGEQAEQGDLRIHQEFSRTHVQLLRKGEPALQPCPGGPRSTLKLIDLSMHGARGRNEQRIIRRRSERFRPVGHRERLGIFRAQAKHPPESVQQAPSHRMLRSFVEQRVRSPERALCFDARAKHSGSGKAVKRSDGDLQCVALGTIWRLLEQRRRTFDDPDALFRAEVRKSGFGGLGVVAQGGHRLAAKLEVHGEFRRGDRRACAHARVRAWRRLCGGAATEPTGSCARTAPGERARA